jgi:hypothetical protein
MIVYPTWETTPSPNQPLLNTALQEQPKKKKKKKSVKTIDKIVSSSEQLPLFIDDYAINNVKPDLDKLISKLTKKISSLNPNAFSSNQVFYDPNGFIPFPKHENIYLEAFNKAAALSFTSGGTTSITIEVTKDQIPPVIMQLPHGMVLTNEEVAEAFGLPSEHLDSLSIEVCKDLPDQLQTYKVTIVRKNPEYEDLF